VQVYGEDKANPTATNHIGRPWKSYDGAGLVEIREYDFKEEDAQAPDEP